MAPVVAHQLLPGLQGEHAALHPSLHDVDSLQAPLLQSSGGSHQKLGVTGKIVQRLLGIQALRGALVKSWQFAFKS